MTKREQLREEYEDALFALMMDEFAVAEGEKALEENERLKKDPDFVVPTEVERRCLKTISRHCTEQSIHAAGRTFSRIVSKVAIVALVGMLLFTTAFAASPEFRANTLNWVIEVFDDRTEFSLLSPSIGEESGDSGYTLKTAWLPDGYALIEENSNDSFVINTYQSSDGPEISIAVFSGTNSTLGLDTEDAVVKTIDIQGVDALLVKKGTAAQVAWADEIQQIYIVIDGPIDQTEDLIKIARNLTVSLMYQEKKMTVLRIDPNKVPSRVELGNDLSTLQGAVGGYIEAVYPFDDPVALVVNDEGKLNGLPLNRALRDDDGHIYDVVAGSFLVVGLAESGFTSLSPELMDKYEKLFHRPEAFINMGGHLLVVPAPEPPKTKSANERGEAR